MALLQDVVYFECTDFIRTENNTKVVPRFKIEDNQVIFILLMGNFCGFCTQIKPEWEMFARELKDNPSVIIGGMILDHGKHNEREHKAELNEMVQIITDGKMKGVPCFISYNNKTGWHVADGIDRARPAFHAYIIEQYGL